jgi:hypothetical protein
VRANKLFVSGAIFPPAEWLRAVEDQRHIRQGGLIVVASVKTDVERMLEARRPWAGQLAKEMRLRRPPYSNTTTLLVEAGLISLDVPAVYVEPLNYGRNGDKIARVEPDGTPTVIGVYRYDGKLGAERTQWVEAV